jgi:fructosamine-3-kinase
MLEQVPLAIQREISSQLKCTLAHFEFISGGCINHGGRIKTSKGIFFLKWNSAEKYPGMFHAEAEGLKILRSASTLRIPEVTLHGASENFQFLLIEFIDQAKPSTTYWQKLGEQLSDLHKTSSPQYGLAFDNYIGSLSQQNTKHQSWTTFFIEERLKPQLKLALGNGKIKPDIAKKFDQLFEKIPLFIIEDKPSLLHGDLWSGNLIVDDKGDPCVIDPAVFYGNREAEIAFTQLFGGFDDEFYASYHANFPLENSFKSRIDLYNLYPLLVHLNLFGGGYFTQVVSILKNFV